MRLVFLGCVGLTPRLPDTKMKKIERFRRAKLGAASQLRSLADRVAEAQTMTRVAFGFWRAALSLLAPPVGAKLSLLAPRAVRINHVGHRGTDQKLEIDVPLQEAARRLAFALTSREPFVAHRYLIRHDVDFALGRLSQQRRHPAAPGLEIRARTDKQSAEPTPTNRLRNDHATFIPCCLKVAARSTAG
jgi:hypothetical protein